MTLKSDLFEFALKSRENAYAPYSRFKVGASILAENGKIYSGTNVENISYPCGTCAEESAISAMIKDGQRKIKEIAIVADSQNLITPCGACLQRIFEFSDQNTVVHLADLKGIQKSYLISELLPHSFHEESLKND